MTESRDAIRMARSTAGHDKGKVYVVVREDPEYIYLADGASRSMSSPKKKNRKHIQIIEKVPAHILEVFTDGERFGDAEIDRALKLYSRTDAEREEA